MGNRADGITITGLNEVIDIVKNMEIDDYTETMLLNECKPFTEEIKANHNLRGGVVQLER